ncbi:hypothetical protein [Ktedonobacter robiniae]|uniref:Zinc-ribbon 15 domain-containing protein n=1 Tax=Ktedonobacter robiniae TaxID=2778365 RepID=A0ABQ3US07_9CHLR|nr:hypothetical protein [Ktedonobacter robiniae]GHO55485.1 hypothetical protein KSB_39600 [Ktedonobacter robiniae]
MRIDIALEDVQVDREQKEHEPVLGRCDICRKADAGWTMKFNWVRNKFYIVPSLIAYAFICEDCHTNMDTTREVVRQHLEQQANYRADQYRRNIVEMMEFEDRNAVEVSE